MESTPQLLVDIRDNGIPLRGTITATSNDPGLPDSLGQKTSAGSTSVVFSSDGTLPALAAGTALVGKVGIDQTTPGTTNAVQITGAPVRNEDTASADGDSGFTIFAVRRATPVNSSGTDGDYEPLQISGGKLWTTANIDQAIAGNTNATQQKQYTGVPSSFSVATADGTVFTLAAGEIGFIQNLDSSDALAVKKGASASTSSFSLILSCGSAQDDGRGGSVTIDDWIGAVSVATMTGTARYIAYKIAP